MSKHPRAGQPAGPQDLVDVARLVTAYYTEHPDPDDPAQRVAFGTSGPPRLVAHAAFNDDHIAATSQAICEYRAGSRHRRPAVPGQDTHALSEPAWATALEVFAANDVTRARRQPRPLHADAGAVARDPPATTAAAPAGPRRRRRRHAVAQPARATAASSTTRRTAARPAATSPAGSRTRANELLRDGLTRRTPRPAGAGARRRHDRRPTTSSAATSTTCRPCSTSTRSATRACASAPTRSAARASTTGARSPTATGSTSRSSTRSSTRPGGS